MVSLWTKPKFCGLVKDDTRGLHEAAQDHIWERETACYQALNPFPNKF